jgi:hypothetical protein
VAAPQAPAVPDTIGADPVTPCVERSGAQLGVVLYPVGVVCMPMTIAKLAAFVPPEADFEAPWRLVVEFLMECHREPTV